MPLFAELVRHDRAVPRTVAELRSISLEQLRKHVAWRTRDNPVQRFRVRFESDLPAIAQRGMAHYHAWVFGTLRQLGAASELSAAYLRWLESGTVRAIRARGRRSFGHFDHRQIAAVENRTRGQCQARAGRLGRIRPDGRRLGAGERRTGEPVSGRLQDCTSHPRTALTAGWEVGTARGPGDIRWSRAAVPGTVAGSLRATGQWSFESTTSLDAQEWWLSNSIRGGAGVAGRARNPRLRGTGYARASALERSAVVRVREHVSRAPLRRHRTVARRQ